MWITLILRLALAYALSDISECCFKSSSSAASDGNTGAAGSPQSPSSIIGATTTVSGPGANRLDCTPAEVLKTDCQNDGVCSAVLNANSVRVAFCVCTPEWTGAHCEERNIKLGAIQSAGTTAIVPIVVSIGAFVAVAVGAVAIFFVVRRRRQKSNKSTKNTQAKETFASYFEKNNGVQENHARDEVPTVDKAPTIPEDLTYDYDQSVDGSSEQLANREEARKETLDVVHDVMLRHSRVYNYNPITIQPFADRRSIGNTSLQYPESICSRSSTYSQIRQHETSI